MESNPVRIEELLAHAGWVKKLAVRLVRDAGLADDVSQEVWAQALRSPPRDRSNLRAWLSAAVRNSVRSLKRAEVRRADREAAVDVREEEPSTSEIVERAQLHRHLVELVLALEEPHRSIVLAHWFEGQTLAEIARRQHMTERVVKARLDAGHALLRQRLDKSPGGRGAWCAAFTKWIGPSLAPAGAGTALTVGGIFVASKLVVVSAVVVVVATLGWLLWPAFEAQPTVASAGNAPETRMLDPLAQTNQLVQENTGSARESLALAGQSNPATAATATPMRWVVRGHVRGAPAGRERETQLSARFIGRYVIEDKAVAQVSSDGSFEIDVTAPAMRWLRETEPNEIQVRAQHPLCMGAWTQMPFASAKLDSSSSSVVRVYRCDFTLTTAAIVTGRIAVPSDWRALGDSARAQLPRVGLFDFVNDARSWRDDLDAPECDTLGNWTLRASRSGLFTVIACAESLRPVSLELELTLGQTTDVGTLELTRGESVSGTVRRVGQPVEAGTVVVAEWKERQPLRFMVSSSAGPTSTLFRSDRVIEFWEARTLTKADGSYSFDGLAPAEYTLHVESAANARFQMGGQPHVERTVRAPQSGVDLGDVPPTIELAVRVGGRIATNADLKSVKLSVVAQNSGSMSVGLDNRADDFGRIQLAPGVAYELSVESGRCAPIVKPIGPFAFGDAHTVSIDLVPQDRWSTLVVRLVTDPPLAVEGVEIAVQDLDPNSSSAFDWNRVKASERNTFVLRDHVPGRYRVHVRSGEAYASSAPVYFLPAEFDVVLEAKATVEHELRPVLGGRMRVSVKNEQGDYVSAKADLLNEQREVVETRFWCLTERGLFGCDWQICEYGPNEHPPLPAGHYELTLTGEGLAPQVVPIDLVRGETRILDIVLHPR